MNTMNTNFCTLLSAALLVLQSILAKIEPCRGTCIVRVLCTSMPLVDMRRYCLHGTRYVSVPSVHLFLGTLVNVLARGRESLSVDGQQSNSTGSTGSIVYNFDSRTIL